MAMLPMKSRFMTPEAENKYIACLGIQSKMKILNIWPTDVPVL